MEPLHIFFTGLGATIALSLFAKFLPKEKLLSWIKPPCYNLGIIISKFLISKLGKKAAEKIEEGAIITILECIGKAPLFVVEGLREDNKKNNNK